MKNKKRVEAGRKGGLISPTNFKHNRVLASIAGKRSVIARHKKKKLVDEKISGNS